MQSDVGMKIFHWCPEEDRWEDVSWDAWVGFRGVQSRGVPLPGVAGGIHHFVVAVFDDEELCNLIPHKYLIDIDGTIGSGNFHGLTKEDRDDYSHLLIAREMSPEDKKRWEEINTKNESCYDPPRESIHPLLWAIFTRPRPGSAADNFLRQFR